MTKIEKKTKPYECRFKLNVIGSSPLLNNKVSKYLKMEFDQLENVKIVEYGADYILDIEPKQLRNNDGSKGKIIIKIIILKALFDKLKYLQTMKHITIKKEEEFKIFCGRSNMKLFMESWLEMTTTKELKEDCRKIISTIDKYIIEAKRERSKLSGQ